MAEAARGPVGSALPSGTVAFLFSDIEGSTRLLRRLRADYPHLIEEHHRLLREAVETNGGRVVDSHGDSCFAVFSRVRDAAAAAAEAQRALAAREWPEHVEVNVRMGVHAGEPTLTRGRYIGLEVHRAARIAAAARGGQVLVSQAAASLLVDNEPPGLGLRDLGEYLLKDFDRPQRLYQLVIEGLRSKFPPIGTARARARTKPGFEFRILGPLEVVGEAGHLPLGGEKQRAVLAVLLIHAGDVVSNDRLIDALWGERPPPTATASLQNAIVKLRKVLGPDQLVTRAPGYLLSVEPDQVDVKRFERLVSESRGAPPEQRAGQLREALSLWRGPPLADFTFAPFAEGEIRRLEELRLVAVEERIDAELELGRDAELVGELEGLVAEYPLRERLRGQMMLALYRSGRQAEALQAYHNARKSLVDELGIEPSRSLQQLHASILRQEAGLEPAAPGRPIVDHYDEVIRAMLGGHLVPILGSGVNLGSVRDGDGSTKPGLFLPDGTDVVAHLADCFRCPPEQERDITHVSQYVALMQGVGPLYDELHGLLDRDYEPGPVQRFLAAAAGLLSERRAPAQLVVSTNHDLTLERAFAEAGEQFDVVSYVATGRSRGKFLHVAADGTATVVEVPNAYAAIPTDRAVILKLHGQVDRSPDREWESFVVSEDDYIDYLAQSELAALVPVTIAARLRRSHFLFLGYRVQEWRLRVFLNRVWGQEKAAYRAWAVETRPDPLEREFWRQRSVELFDLPLDRYVDELERRIAQLPEPAAE